MPGEFNFRDTKQGDTYSRVDFEIIAESGIPADLSGALIKMQLRRSFTALAVKTYEIGTGFAIIDSLLGKFSLSLGILNVPADNYYYDIQITYPSGINITYVEGRINITPDIAR